VKWRLLINYGFYYLLLTWVYGGDWWLQAEILVLLVFLGGLEWHLKPVWDLNERVKKGIVSLQQYLRIGYSPLRAYEKALEEIPMTHSRFKENLNQVMDHKSRIFEVIQGERGFNHQSFQRELSMILRRIRWKEEIHSIHRRNMWEVELMRYLPLIILGFITEVRVLEPLVKGLSVFMVFLAQGTSLYIVYHS